jgi:hypothetical protein
MSGSLQASNVRNWRCDAISFPSATTPRLAAMSSRAAIVSSGRTSDAAAMFSRRCAYGAAYPNISIKIVADDRFVDVVAEGCDAGTW